MNKVRYYKIWDCAQRSDSALKTERPQSTITFVMLKITKQIEKYRFEKLESPRIIARTQHACR